ncbi:MAG: hypothetical protein ACE5E7_06425 [Anaerolineae bacterium]
MFKQSCNLFILSVEFNKMVNRLYRAIFSIGIISLLVSCANLEESTTLEFVVTPEEGGQPAFLKTDNDNMTSNSVAGYPGPETGYPGPLSSGLSGYPAPVSEYSQDGRLQTALQSYSLANPVALAEFHPDAYLAAIVPSNIMMTNLGNPPVLPGWFFKFRRPDSRREFIVHVVDNVITGTTLTEAAMDVGPTERPIDLSQVNLDSPDVLEQFQKVGVERGIWSENIVYDLELVNLEGTNGPVWSVVNPITQEWLYFVDAVTGEETDNPYQG